jgi:hypothetical protein
MPRDKPTVLNSKIDLKRLHSLNLLDKVMKPWVAKKIKELLGVEE